MSLMQSVRVGEVARVSYFLDVVLGMSIMKSVRVGKVAQVSYVLDVVRGSERCAKC